MSDKIYTPAEIEKALDLGSGHSLQDSNRRDLQAIIKQLRGELNDARATATAAKEVGTDMAVRQNEIIESLHASAKAKREKIAALKKRPYANHSSHDSAIYDDAVDDVLTILDEETP